MNTNARHGNRLRYAGVLSALLVPTVRLTRGAVVDFETIAFETTDTSGAFVPAPGPEGVLQTYRIHQLRGSAQEVVF